MGAPEPGDSTRAHHPENSMGAHKPRGSVGTHELGDSMGASEPGDSMGASEPGDSMGADQPGNSMGTHKQGGSITFFFWACNRGQPELGASELGATFLSLEVCVQNWGRKTGAMILLVLNSGGGKKRDGAKSLV